MGRKKQYPRAHKLPDRERTKDIGDVRDFSFAKMTLSDSVQLGLKKNHFIQPSLIQHKAIPLGRGGIDLLIQSKSGTGKTLAFVTIILESYKADIRKPQSIVLAPTREIAVQIEQVLANVACCIMDFKAASFIGGMDIAEDRKRVQNCSAVVGTPGRILHLIKNKVLSLDKIRTVVLDEADQLMNASFRADITAIIKATPPNRQILAASATFADGLDKELAKFMRNPIGVSADRQVPILLGVKQFGYNLSTDPPMSQHSNREIQAKIRAIIGIFKTVPFKQCLMFSNSQSRALSYGNYFNQNGWVVEVITGAQVQPDRLKIFKNFQTFQCRILIATDLMARGVDSENVDLVINLDVPVDGIVYLHRIGRCGRFGSLGIAITLIGCVEDEKKFQNILGYLGGATMHVLKFPQTAVADLWSYTSMDVREKIFGTAQPQPSEISLKRDKERHDRFLTEKSIANGNGSAKHDDSEEHVISDGNRHGDSRTHSESSCDGMKGTYEETNVHGMSEKDQEAQINRVESAEVSTEPSLISTLRLADMMVSEGHIEMIEDDDLESYLAGKYEIEQGHAKKCEKTTVESKSEVKTQNVLSEEIHAPEEEELKCSEFAPEPIEEPSSLKNFDFSSEMLSTLIENLDKAHIERLEETQEKHSEPQKELHPITDTQAVALLAVESQNREPEPVSLSEPASKDETQEDIFQNGETNISSNLAIAQENNSDAAMQLYAVEDDSNIAANEEIQTESAQSVDTLPAEKSPIVVTLSDENELHLEENLFECYMLDVPTANECDPEAPDSNDLVEPTADLIDFNSFNTEHDDSKYFNEDSLEVNVTSINMHSGKVSDTTDTDERSAHEQCASGTAGDVSPLMNIDLLDYFTSKNSTKPTTETKTHAASSIIGTDDLFALPDWGYRESLVRFYETSDGELNSNASNFGSSISDEGDDEDDDDNDVTEDDIGTEAEELLEAAHDTDEFTNDEESEQNEDILNDEDFESVRSAEPPVNEFSTSIERRWYDIYTTQLNQIRSYVNYAKQQRHLRCHH